MHLNFCRMCFFVSIFIFSAFVFVYTCIYPLLALVSSVNLLLNFFFYLSYSCIFSIFEFYCRLSFWCYCFKIYLKNVQKNWWKKIPGGSLQVAVCRWQFAGGRWQLVGGRWQVVAGSCNFA